MKYGNNELDNICMDVADVFQAIMSGECREIFNNRNARSIGPGYVAEQIGQTINNVGMAAMMGVEVPAEELAKVIAKLMSICKTFGVKSLRKPISDLIEYTQNTFSLTEDDFDKLMEAVSAEES